MTRDRHDRGMQRRPVVQPDPAFPHLHGRPPVGWVNDPNGLCRVAGRYHVFFQFNPDGPYHDRIHWGHMSSTDLVSWHSEPIALVPRPRGVDAFGCWSGCVVIDDGVPTAVYSAVADDSGRSAVVLARSDRSMRSWTADVEPVTGMPDDSGITDVRDPFVFTVDGHRFAVQGAGSRHAATPRLLVYACDDIAGWEPRGVLLDGDDPYAARVAPANVWECPNVVHVDGRWVVLVSLWERVEGRDELNGVRWLLGDLTVDDGRPRFHPRSGGLLDAGPSFYAPQVLADDGRILLWAWSWEHGRPQHEIDDVGWAGCLTFPRELTIVDEVVVVRPAPELRRLRRAPLPVALGEPFAAAAFELEPPEGTRVTLSLVGPPDPGRDGPSSRAVGTWTIADELVVAPRILVDGAVVEIFDGGPTAFTTRAYPTAGSRWVIDIDGPLPGTVRAWHLGRP